MQILGPQISLPDDQSPGTIKMREVVLDPHEEVRHFSGSRRDQEEGGELDPHEEVSHFCGSRLDQEERGGAGPSS